MLNMRRTLTSVVALALLCASMTGCTTRVADLTIACTGNVNLDKVDLDTLPQKKDVIGKDAVFIFLFIPFGTPNLEEAVDDTLRKGDGDVLVDAVVSSGGWWFIVGQSYFQVRGNVINTRGAK